MCICTHAHIHTCTLTLTLTLTLTQTPVCTTELGTASKLEPEFTKRGVKLIALSVDSLESHHGWVKDINETQDTELTFPIIADPERIVASLYSMLSLNAADTMAGKLTVRSVFIIDSNKKCRLTLTYPAATGRMWMNIRMCGCVGACDVGVCDMCG
jgi:thioredoxin-dependent peroxiredoxin